MANTNQPFGLLPLGLNNAQVTPSYGLKPAKFASNLTVKAGRGDGLKRLATGYVDPIVAAGTAASQWAGIFWSCSYLSISQGKRITTPYWPGGDNSGEVDVLMIPLTGSGANPLFYAQTLSTAIVFADQGANVDIAYAAPTVVGVTARSNTTLAQSTLGTSNALPWIVEGLWSDLVPAGQPGTDDASSYNWVIVAFNGTAITGLTA